MNYARINVITHTHTHKLSACRAASVFKSTVSYATCYTPNVARASRVNALTRATVGSGLFIGLRCAVTKSAFNLKDVGSDVVYPNRRESLYDLFIARFHAREKKKR